MSGHSDDYPKSDLKSHKKVGGVLSNVIIIGCGDIGRRVAQLYTDKQPVLGLIQGQTSAQACKKQGVKAFRFDLDSTLPLPPQLIDNIKDAGLYYFAPPPSTGTQDTRLKAFLDNITHANAIPARIVLISTTGVYGDSKGEWIDEATPLKPVAERAKRRLSAEQNVQAFATKHSVKTVILRVPGIYANDRLPLARLKKGLPIVKKEEAGFTNRIHADDLANICKSAMESKCVNDTIEVINVCDGSPSSMTDYFNHIADYANLPRPPQITMAEAEATLSAGMVSYLKESRRIKNNKMLMLLNVELVYPNLETALPTNKIHKK